MAVDEPIDARPGASGTPSIRDETVVVVGVVEMPVGTTWMPREKGDICTLPGASEESAGAIGTPVVIAATVVVVGPRKASVRSAGMPLATLCIDWSEAVSD